MMLRQIEKVHLSPRRSLVPGPRWSARAPLGTATSVLMGGPLSDAVARTRLRGTLRRTSQQEPPAGSEPAGGWCPLDIVAV